MYRATSTLTFCDARAAKIKRNAVPQIAPTTTGSNPTFVPLPYYIQPYPTTDVSSACSCLDIPTPAVTVTSTRTALGDHIFVTDVSTTTHSHKLKTHISQVAANITTTPYYNTTVTSTPVSTTQVTVYATYIGAPNSTIPPTYLPSPTLLSSDQTADDYPFTLSDLPFEVTFFGIGTTSLSISPNGVRPFHPPPPCPSQIRPR